MAMILAGTLAQAGCDRLFGLESLDLLDAADDASVDALCFGQGAFEICLTSAPTDAISYAVDTVIDTTNGCSLVYRLPGGASCCVMAATMISVDAVVSATGQLPLVLLATNELDVTGRIDVASHRTGTLGAGGNDPACSVSGAGAPNTNGGGGGAGGSFGTTGGNGGNGTSGAVSGGTAGAATSDGNTLRGGCAGGLGGAGSVASRPAGQGGGAVYLVAGSRIVISGTIDASGGGGNGGVAPKGGGGGGGSGGMIALSAPTITWSGTMFATGGGGGGGADNGASGLDGEDPSSPTTQARGGYGGATIACGSGPGCGGDGAAGATGAKTGVADTTGAGGGGGGGGFGVIRVLSGQSLSLNISPNPTP